MRTPTLLLAAGAAALLLAACTDEQTLDDFLDPVEESDDDTPDNADDGDDDDGDDGDGVEEAEPEVDPAEQAAEDVTGAFVELLAAADRYDSGAISYDELADHLTVSAADAAEGLWAPHPSGEVAMGERHASGQPDIELSDDGTIAQVTDCVWDRRFPTGTDEWEAGEFRDDIMPYGLTHEVTAEFHLTDDGWRAERFYDPFSEEDGWTECLPPDIEEELLEAAAAESEAMWDSHTVKWAPDYDGHQLSPSAQHSTARLRSNFAESGNVAVLDIRYRLDVVIAEPHSVVVGACDVADRAESYDPDTGERASEANGTQQQSGFWFIRTDVDAPWRLQYIYGTDSATEENLGTCDGFDRQWDSGNLDDYDQP